MRMAAFVLSMCLMLCACGGEEDCCAPPPTVVSVAVTPSSFTLVSLGETVQLGASARDAGGNAIPGKTFTWSSSDVSVATVSNAGLVTAVENGAATITATSDGVSGDADVTVAQEVAAVTVTPATARLTALEETVQLTAGAEDAKGHDVAGKTFTWSSSDESVATVSASGLVTAVANGSSTITAAADNVSGTATIWILPEGDFELVDGVNITMVWIPVGEFEMGSPVDEVGRDNHEGPVHTVTIQTGFWMSKYEVTQGQWEAVIGTNPAHGHGVGPNHPVYYVSWNDIQGFLGQTNIGFRLPSEAEWEYAARAGRQTRFYWGDDSSYSEIDDYAVHSGDDPGRTAEVGTKQPNAWGLHDMSGNVWEWVEDDYHSSYSGAPNDGAAWTDDPRATYRVLRGGSWATVPAPWLCRSAYRHWDTPLDRFFIYGFRVVLAP